MLASCFEPSKSQTLWPWCLTVVGSLFRATHDCLPGPLAERVQESEHDEERRDQEQPP